MKKVSGLLLLMLLSYQGLAQERSAQKHKFWELRSGLTIDRYQDLKSSAVRLSGVAIPLGFYKGWYAENKRTLVGLDLRPGLLTSSLNDVTEVASLVIGLNYERLYKVNAKAPFFDVWYLGGSAGFRVQRLVNDRLGNSANNAIYNLGFAVTSQFEKPIRFLKRDLTLSYGLSLGLLNYVKEDNSFTFSVPQEALENGDFDTQNFENGLFEYGDITSLNGFTNIRSRIALEFPANRRSSWIFAYDWQLVRYSKVSDRAATSAAHTFSIARHIPSKKK